MKQSVKNLKMDDEEVKKICGNGEPMDRLTASSLGFLNVIEKSQPSESTNEDLLLLNEERHGWNALMYAAYYHKRNIIQYIMSFTPDHVPMKSLPDKLSNTCLIPTPLTLAVLSGDLSSVQLLSPRADLNGKDSSDKTALWWAVETNRPDIVKYLLKQGASPNVICDGKSYVGEAARQGNANLVEILLQYGVEVCLQQPTPLILAMESGNLQAASLLLTYILEKYGLKEMLRQVKLDKFWPVFSSNNIGYQQFVNMTENDLKHCGISLLGPRKKLGLLISLLKANN